MSSGKATAGITVGNSAAGFFSGDFPPPGFKPCIFRTAVSVKKLDRALELAQTRDRSPEGDGGVR